jgi:uncharacterized FlaG/YvyC family protein
MTELGPGPIGRLIPMPSQPAGARAPRTSPVQSSPPPELQRDFAAAQQVAADLQSRQVNLNFDVDSDTGRVKVKLIGSSGQVLREMPATHLLDALSGGGVLIDEQA